MYCSKIIKAKSNQITSQQKSKPTPHKSFETVCDDQRD